MYGLSDSTRLNENSVRRSNPENRKNSRKDAYVIITKLKNAKQ